LRIVEGSEQQRSFDFASVAQIAEELFSLLQH